MKTKGRRRYRKRNKKPKVSKAVQKYVKKTIREFPELKMQEATYTTATGPNSNVWAAGVVPPLFTILFNGITQGTNEGNRVAQQISMQKLDITFNYRNNAVTASDSIGRFMVILDHESNGIVPDYAVLFNSAVAASVPVSQLNIEGTNEGLYGGQKSGKRYSVLYDILLNPNAVGGATDQHALRHVKIHLNLRNTKVQYTANGATITAIQRNALYAIGVSNNGAFVSPDFSWRLLYTDA